MARYVFGTQKTKNGEGEEKKKISTWSDGCNESKEQCQ